MRRVSVDDGRVMRHKRFKRAQGEQPPVCPARLFGGGGGCVGISLSVPCRETSQAITGFNRPKIAIDPESVHTVPVY